MNDVAVAVDVDDERCVACLESLTRRDGWRLTCCSGRACRACGDSGDLGRSLERSGCPLCRSVSGGRGHVRRLVLTMDDENHLVTTLRSDHGDPELASLDETTTDRAHGLVETANEEMMRFFERAFVVEGETFEMSSVPNVDAFVDVATRLRRAVRELIDEVRETSSREDVVFVDDVSRVAGPYLAFTFYLDDVYRTVSDVPEDVLGRVRDLDDAFVAAMEPETTFLVLENNVE